MKNETQLIFNADDFGISKETNQAILQGYNEGLLTSASLMANGEAFADAVGNVLVQCKNVGLGIHLNIIEGQSQNFIGEKTYLVDKTGRYRNGFIKLFIKSFDKKFIAEVETDFRQQIETVLKYTEIDHIDSHVHVHSIPNIFCLVCKLAKEYGIKNVRTQMELPYLVPNIKKYLGFKYPINLLKVFLLNLFTLINRRTLKKYGLNSNKYFVGVGYSGNMDAQTIEHGIKRVKNKGEVVEIIVHPTTDTQKNDNYNELLAILNPELKEKIMRFNVKLTKYSEI